MPEPQKSYALPSRDLEAVLELYFFVALLSTSGLDNLIFLTILLAALAVIIQVTRVYNRRGA